MATAEELRRLREEQSIFSALYDMARQQRSELAAEGRRPVLGGLLSKEPVYGTDTLRYEGIGNMLAGLLSPAAKAVDAPISAYRGTIPQEDMISEALGTAGLAMAGGGAVGVPRGAVGANAVRSIKDNHSKVEAKAVKNIAFYANKEGGQAIGNKSVVVPIDRSIYDEYIKPLTNLSYSDHAMQYPSEKYALLTSIAGFDGIPSTGLYKYRGSGPSIEDVMPTAKQYYKEVDSFDTPEAIRHRSTFDSDVVAANASKSTGLLTTAASEAQDMAKRILELRAEGRASEVTDEMMAQADPQYMFANTPLPMDEASRMARAEAAGFEGGLLHGTGADIVGVDKDKLGQKQDLLGIGFYSTTSPKRSERYVPKETDPLTEERVFSEGGNVIPLLARNTAQFDLTKPTGIPNAVKIGKAFEGSDFDVEYRGEGDQVFIKSKTDPQMSVYIDSYQDGIATLQKLKDVFGRNNVTNILEEAGFSGLKAEEGFGNITNLNYEPTDVRSRFARFDPEFAHLSNLSAANVSPLGGLLAQSGVSDKQAERIEEYLRRRGLLD